MFDDETEIERVIEERLRADMENHSHQGANRLVEGGWTDAVIGEPGFATLYHYTEGIRDAITLIVAAFVERERDADSADTLVYPLGFLCRHLLELRLKELYAYLIGTPPLRHELLYLWNHLRPRAEERWPEANRSTLDRYRHLTDDVLQELGIELRSEGTLDRMESLIQDLDALDPKSLSFRYPGMIPVSVRSVSLERLAAIALELDDHLDGLSTAVYEEQSARAEARAEMEVIRAEMEAEACAEMSEMYDGE